MACSWSTMRHMRSRRAILAVILCTPLFPAINFGEAQAPYHAASAPTAVRPVPCSDADYFAMLLHPKSHEELALAISQLAWSGDPRTVLPMIDALHDSDENVRELAAESLGVTKNGRAIEPLIAVLPKLKTHGNNAPDKTDDEYTAATHSLVAIGVPAVEPLIGALKNFDPKVRRQAAIALGDIKDRRAVEPLAAALHDSDPDVRYRAARALSVFKDTRALDTFFALLQAQKQTVGEPCFEGVKWDGQAKTRLAFDAIGMIATPKALEFLLGYVSSCRPDYGGDALGALGKTHSPKALRPLLAALKDTNPDNRKAAAKSLGELGDARAIQPLIDISKDEDEFVRESVIDALDHFNDPRVTTCLVSAMEDSDSFVRQAAIEGLKSRNYPGLIEMLIKYFAEQDENMLREAIASFGPAAVDPLIPLLHSNSAITRESASIVLRKIEDPRVPKVLLQALYEHNWPVIFGARDCFLKRDDPASIDALLHLLQYPVFGTGPDPGLINEYFASGNARLESAAEEETRKYHLPVTTDACGRKWTWTFD